MKVNKRTHAIYTIECGMCGIIGKITSDEDIGMRKVEELFTKAGWVAIDRKPYCAECAEYIYKEEEN